MIHYEILNHRFLRNKSEPQLFLNRGEDADHFQAGLGAAINSVGQLDVIGAGNPVLSNTGRPDTGSRIVLTRSCMVAFGIVAR